MPGDCNRCGACCRVLTVEQSPEEIQAIALLTRVLGIPSDMTFAAEHWHRLERAEALQRNPFYVSRLAPSAHLYWCDQLGADGLCMSHDSRPLVCRGYPWYDQAPRQMPLPDTDCGYIVDQIERFSLPAFA